MKLARLDAGPEIFHSIQGEGKSMGKPFVFVRTSLCNLHCIWCDTDYTWNWEGSRFAHEKDADPGYKKFKKEDYIIELPESEVVKLVLDYECSNVVLTGGEPLLQQEELATLSRELKSKGIAWIEIETNGTLIPTPELDGLVEQYNVSPKLSNSNNPKKLREKPAAYEFFRQSEKANFKFVLSAEADLEEILELKERYELPASRIYLMPEGRNVETLNKRQRWLVDVCKEYGFNYTDRLHIHIYGNKRGI